MKKLAMRASLLVKILGSVLLVSLIFFIPLAYFNIKNSRLILEDTYVEKARTIARLLDASIKNMKELKDKSRLYTNIQKNIWLDPDICSIDINLPHQDALVTYVSNDSKRVGHPADADNLESYKNDRMIRRFEGKSNEKGNHRHLRLVTPIHLAKQQVGTYQIELTLEHVDAEISRAIKVSIFSYLVMIFSFLLLLFLVLRFIIIKPLFELNRGVEAIAKRDLNFKVNIKSKDEIGDLAGAFNQMAQDLERTTVSKEILKEQKAELASTNKMLIGEVNQRKHAQQKLHQARKAAEVASRAKSEFLANMSHELRTPLNHIIGFTEIVMDERIGPVNKKQHDYLNNVHQSSQHLLSLINDILDLSKVEAGKLELTLSHVDLSAFLENSLLMVKEKAIKHGLSMSTDIDGVKDLIKADERMLKQIIYNLLSNAVKFTPDGGSIVVRARTCEITRQKNESSVYNGQPGVKISVIDTGVGLKPEDIDRIFYPFEQVDGTASRRFQGTGLGLSLTKRLVELHGGRLWAQSKGEGKGSTFCFVIPRHVQSHSPDC